MIRTHSLTFHVVRCDTCGNQNRMVADGFSSEVDAVTDAMLNGWRVVESGHLCPRCTTDL